MTRLKDIAAMAGVSVGTVDRILHNRGRYSNATAGKVRRIIDKMEYTPNLMARNLSQTKSCRIAALLPKPDQDSQYWALPLQGIRQAMTDLLPFGLSLDTIHFDRYNPKSFAKAGHRIIDGNYDGLLMTPLIPHESQELVDRLPEKTPVVFFDTDLPGTKRLCCFGQDSRRCGRLAARLMSLLIGTPHGSVLIVAPQADNVHIADRLEGFAENYPGTATVLRTSIESDHESENLHRRIEEHLLSGTAGLFVADASTHFAAEYLATRLEEQQIHIPLIGHDLVPENRRWLSAGVIDFLLTQSPFTQGYEGVNRLFRKIFIGENGPANYNTPTNIIARENLAYTVEERE